MEQLTPKEAMRLLTTNPQALLIDCRSDREFRFVGHPVGALHAPWLEDAGFAVNPGFVATVAKFAGDALTRPIVLICRTGDRAPDAGRALEAFGFSSVFVVSNGFEGDVGADFQRGGVNGWRFDGLPWETSACNQCRG
jgi:rhodanese-related sulfurtransferase